MVSSSKILTVSYGTFSCTAEGFEDPLAAVKDATRFYQGVVREDRFFGSEPPQLDAEMAEQMMAQQIGAEYGADGLILRPALGAPAAASSGALAAALAAGPARAKARPVHDTPVHDAAVADASGDATTPLDTDADTDANAPAAQAPAKDSAPASDLADPLEDGTTGVAGDESAEKASDALDASNLADDLNVQAAHVGDAADLSGADLPDAMGADAAADDASSPDIAEAAEMLEAEDMAEPVTTDMPSPEAPVAIADDIDPLADIESTQADTALPDDSVADFADTAFDDMDLEEETVQDLGPETVADAMDTVQAASAPTQGDTPAPDTSDDAVANLMATSFPDAGASASAAPEEPTAQPPAPAPVGSLDSVAAKLQRIRAVVTRSNKPAAPVAVQPTAEEYSEDEHATDATTDTYQDVDMAGVLGAVSEQISQPPAPLAADTIQAETDETATDGFEDEFAELADDAAKADDTTDLDDAVEALNENLFTDTIADIVGDSLAASGQDDKTLSLDDDDDDDDETDADIALFDDAVTDAAAQIEDDLDLQETHADLAEPAVAKDDTDPDDMVQAALPEETPLRRTRVIKVKRADFDAAVAAGQLEAIDEDTGDTTTSSLSAEEEEELARELAAVEAELDADDWDDDDDDWPEVDSATLAARSEDGPLRLDNQINVPDTPVAQDKAAASALHDELDAYEDQDDAQDASSQDRRWDDTGEDDEDFDKDAPVELVGENNIDPEELEQLALSGARKAVKMSSPARVMLTENRIEEDDTSVDRILDETNTQLEEPEGNRRRSAIAHLRAAVAATRADRLLGRKKDPEEDFEPYREDLANVVRPRRPQTKPVTRSERPRTDVRPAPLKLVAEQRVDDAPKAAAPSAPVRPRRVRTTDLDGITSGPLEEDTDTSGFADYAEDMGATELSELLEAAASYMAFVEGRDQFSRPQLMTKVRQVEAQESSREDRLRSFGQLLREGKIEKTRGGRFTASDTISFKPKARAAG